MKDRLLRGGLYVITDSQLLSDQTLIPAVTSALRGGAGMLQYRDKISSPEQRMQQASALLELCRQFDVPLIINDDIALAKSIGADGVHLGRDDDAPGQAREALGPEAIIGISGYDRPQAVQTAEADYVAFGRLFASSTKPEASTAKLQIFSQAKAISQASPANSPVPLVGIGGINQDNAEQVIQAGADWLAVVAAVFAAADIETATRQLCQHIAQRL